MKKKKLVIGHMQIQGCSDLVNYIDTDEPYRESTQESGWWVDYETDTCYTYHGRSLNEGDEFEL